MLYIDGKLFIDGRLFIDAKLFIDGKLFSDGTLDCLMRTMLQLTAAKGLSAPRGPSSTPFFTVTTSTPPRSMLMMRGFWISLCACSIPDRSSRDLHRGLFVQYFRVDH